MRIRKGQGQCTPSGHASSPEAAPHSLFSTRTGARQRHAGKPSGGLEAVDEADPASLDLLHASVVRLVGAAKTRSVFRGLFHHAYVDLVQMMGPALAAEVGKAAERCVGCLDAHINISL